MNSFLLIVILAICGGSYYEYTVLNQAKLEDQQQITDLQAKVTKLQELNTALAKGRTDLPANFAELQSKAPGTLPAAPTDPSKPAENASVAAQPVSQPTTMESAAAPANGPSNELGTIVTVDARTFQNCRLLKVQADGITFKHSEGITKVLFPLLPPDIQKRFNFDPHQPFLPDDEVLHQEDLRRAAAQAAGP